ncbi:fumarylacetoacetate hydrolase family protein [Rhodococcus marinonascens]|uniref:fumarylacetoacetate hydrolase family protein n=1 Tax=Rhodococcus marinonascens TaxID=38311 RepID=UPI000932B427|nr:fumarylacetoacetate hydrolase family protein [Rhodococcus marinonascens]
MRIASVGGRIKLVRESKLIDVHKVSDGRFGPTAADVFEQWTQFRDWAAHDTTEGDTPLNESEADAPVPPSPQVFGIGLNYREHQIESGLPAPEVPLVFTKFPTSITNAFTQVALPTDQVDWEVEVAIVMGARAHQVSRSDAWSYVAGVTAAQDFSARDVQMRPAGLPQFNLGKSFPGFTPLGPVLVTPDEFDDPDNITLSCDLNGVTLQSSSTADLIFDVGQLIEYLSGIVILLPGDVILTGTPSGVGLGQTPNRFLTAGDEVVSRVGDLTMRHTFVAAGA